VTLFLPRSVTSRRTTSKGTNDAGAVKDERRKMLQQHVRAGGSLLGSNTLSSLFRCCSRPDSLAPVALFHCFQMKGGEVSEDMLDAVGDMQLVESVALLSGGPHNDFVCVTPRSIFSV
jgi:hypothetical protein